MQTLTSTINIPPLPPPNSNRVTASIDQSYRSRRKRRRMGRLATIGVLLVALVVMAQASLYQAIEVDEENQYQRERCREELRGRRLHSCQRYLQRGGGGYYVLSRMGGYRESLEDCCDELRDVERRCRCDAIERALDDAQREGRYGGERRRRFEEERRGYRGREEEREMERRAENLPSRCRMERPRHCEIRGYY